MKKESNLKCAQFKTIVRSAVAKAIAYILLSTLQIWKKPLLYFTRTFLFDYIGHQSQKCCFLIFSTQHHKS